MGKGNQNSDKIGVGKFWAWQTRAASAAANFIVLSFVSLYCTDALGLSPALVGGLLMASKVVDAITDLFAGYIVDKTHTKWGKGRPYEWFIVIEWILTWLMYSVPGEASTGLKAAWVLVMYIVINSICTTFLSAAQNPYMIRAFGSDNQRVKLASFGGIVIMVASMAVNVILPTMINKVRTDISGWSRIMLCISIPMALVGILRFVFVKETVQVEDNTTGEKVSVKDTLEVLKKNPYVWMVGLMYFGYYFVTGMGINTYFFTWVVGNLDLMGTASLIGVVALPLLFFFPTIMKKITKGLLVQIACIFYIIAGLIIYYLSGNFAMVLVSFFFTGIASLPITYLTDLMMLDVGTYNQHISGKRMDGTIGAIKGFLGKVGSAAGVGVVGFMLEAAGYNGTAETQTESALTMIRFLIGYLPVIIFAAVAIMMIFYKLDAMLPELNKEQNAK